VAPKRAKLAQKRQILPNRAEREIGVNFMIAKAKRQLAG
jgi:hypothetical protein